MTFLQQFKAARRAGTPLVAVQTPDPAATCQGIAAALANGTTPPLLHWDIVQGVQWLNEPGFAVAWQIFLGKGEYDQPPTSPEEFAAAAKDLALKTSGPGNLVEALVTAADTPDDTILFIANAHQYVKQPSVLQACWNLRDRFKANRRVLVLLGPSFSLPPELVNDTLVLSQPLPTLDDLLTIVNDSHEAAGRDLPDGYTIEPLTDELTVKAVDAVCGLAAFPAEQAISMSWTARDQRVSLDLGELWERKRTMVSQVRGLSVWRGGETFADVGGCDNIKTFLTNLFAGEEPPRVIVLLDEMEKMMAGSEGGDSSGTKQELHGTLLTEMEDQDYTGLVAFGVPGASKTHITKAAGATFGAPVVILSIPDVMEKFVGSSNENFRTALTMIRAISQGRALFIGTCNAMVNLSGPLRRRFCFGEWMFPLPGKEERAAIWKIHLAKQGLTDKGYQLPADEGWTGAEIRNCCRLARRMRVDLRSASAYISPVSRTMSEEIERMYALANGRFQSATYPGVFTTPSAKTAVAAAAKGRRVSFDSKAN